MEDDGDSAGMIAEWLGGADCGAGSERFVSAFEAIVEILTSFSNHRHRLWKK